MIFSNINFRTTDFFRVSKVQHYYYPEIKNLNDKKKVLCTVIYYLFIYLFFFKVFCVFNVQSKYFCEKKAKNVPRTGFEPVT